MGDKFSPGLIWLGSWVPDALILINVASRGDKTASSTISQHKDNKVGRQSTLLCALHFRATEGFGTKTSTTNIKHKCNVVPRIGVNVLVQKDGFGGGGVIMSLYNILRYFRKCRRLNNLRRHRFRCVTDRNWSKNQKFVYPSLGKKYRKIRLKRLIGSKQNFV